LGLEFFSFFFFFFFFFFLRFSLSFPPPPQGTQHLKEKYESDLKRELKKLQRCRDQIKGWVSNNDVKKKQPLLDARKLIESKMEQFKALEREMKMKEYSKEALQKARRKKKDPTKDPKYKTYKWLEDKQSELNDQIEEFEQQIEEFKKGGKKKQRENEGRIDELTQWIEKHGNHVDMLDTIRQRLKDDDVTIRHVAELKESLNYYIESNQDPEFFEDEYMYEVLDEDPPELGQGADDDDIPPPAEDDDDDDDDDDDNHDDNDDCGGDDTNGAASNSVAKGRDDSSAKGSLKAKNSSVTPSDSITNRKSRDTGKRGKVQDDTKSSQSSTRSNKRDDDSRKQRSSSQTKNNDTTKTAKPQTVRADRKQRSASSKDSTSAAGTPTATTPSTTPVIGPGRAGAPSMASIVKRANMPDSTLTAAAATAAVPSSTAVPTPAETGGVAYAAAAAAGANHNALSGRGANVNAVSSTANTANGAATGTIVPPDRSASVEELDAFNLSMLESSMQSVPLPTETERQKQYIPRNPCPTPHSFPLKPATVFDDPSFFSKFDTDTLFFIFYFQQGTPHQYLAARELKRQSWRYHKRYLTWFQRHEDPHVTTDEYEQGKYLYFDYETGWCQRIKDRFIFHYKFLEDELQVHP
jgi:CCR4-NOT transcription complex subunit 3